MPLSVLEASHPTDSPTVICPYGPALTEYGAQVSLFRDAVLGFNCSQSDDCHKGGNEDTTETKECGSALLQIAFFFTMHRGSLSAAQPWISKLGL